MRKPEYISPSALKTWLDDPEEYYLRYLSDHRPDRSLQTQAMAAGSAFDAYAKSYISQAITGKVEGRYELRTIFEAQVEGCNRDWAWLAGNYIFGAYKDSGALADLMFELEQSVSEPRMEMEIRGAIGGYRDGVRSTVGDSRVPILGKPDVYFINKEGAHVILDWKVNGFCSRATVYPMAGYRLLRDCHLPGSKNHLQSHKDFIPYRFKGMEIDGGSYLESRNKEWAMQLTTYGWLLGEEVGAEIVTAIDQICGVRQQGFYDPSIYPQLRVAHHRSRVSRYFQMATLANYQELWRRIVREPFHFFREMSIGDSQARCQQIEDRSKQVFGNSPNEQWFANEIANPPKRFFGNVIK